MPLGSRPDINTPLSEEELNAWYGMGGHRYGDYATSKSINAYGLGGGMGSQNQWGNIRSIIYGQQSPTSISPSPNLLNDTRTQQINPNTPLVASSPLTSAPPSPTNISPAANPIQTQQSSLLAPTSQPITAAPINTQPNMMSPGSISPSQQAIDGMNIQPGQKVKRFGMY